MTGLRSTTAALALLASSVMAGVLVASSTGHAQSSSEQSAPETGLADPDPVPLSGEAQNVLPAAPTTQDATVPASALNESDQIGETTFIRPTLVPAQSALPTAPASATQNGPVPANSPSISGQAGITENILIGPAPEPTQNSLPAAAIPATQNALAPASPSSASGQATETGAPLIGPTLEPNQNIIFLPAPRAPAVLSNEGEPSRPSTVNEQAVSPAAGTAQNQPAEPMPDAKAASATESGKAEEPIAAPAQTEPQGADEEKASPTRSASTESAPKPAQQSRAPSSSPQTSPLPLSKPRTAQAKAAPEADHQLDAPKLATEATGETESPEQTAKVKPPPPRMLTGSVSFPRAFRSEEILKSIFFPSACERVDTVVDAREPRIDYSCREESVTYPFEITLPQFDPVMIIEDGQAILQSELVSSQVFSLLKPDGTQRELSVGAEWSSLLDREPFAQWVVANNSGQGGFELPSCYDLTPFTLSELIGEQPLQRDVTCESVPVALGAAPRGLQLNKCMNDEERAQRPIHRDCIVSIKTEPRTVILLSDDPDAWEASNPVQIPQSGPIQLDASLRPKNMLASMMDQGRIKAEVDGVDIQYRVSFLRYHCRKEQDCCSRELFIPPEDQFDATLPTLTEMRCSKTPDHLEFSLVPQHGSSAEAWKKYSNGGNLKILIGHSQPSGFEILDSIKSDAIIGAPQQDKPNSSSAQTEPDEETLVGLVAPTKPPQSNQSGEKDRSELTGSRVPRPRPRPIKTPSPEPASTKSPPIPLEDPNTDSPALSWLEERQLTALIVVSTTSGFSDRHVVGPVKSKLREWMEKFDPNSKSVTLKLIKIANDGSLELLASRDSQSGTLTSKELLTATDNIQFVGDDNEPLEDLGNVIQRFTGDAANVGALLYIVDGELSLWRKSYINDLIRSVSGKMTVISLGACKNWTNIARVRDETCYDLGEVADADDNEIETFLQTAYERFTRDF